MNAPIIDNLYCRSKVQSITYKPLLTISIFRGENRWPIEQEIAVAKLLPIRSTLNIFNLNKNDNGILENIYSGSQMKVHNTMQVKGYRICKGYNTMKVKGYKKSNAQSIDNVSIYTSKLKS